MNRRRRIALRVAGIAVLLLAAATTVLAIRPPEGRQLAGGFALREVASGLEDPMAFRFAPDGRIFVLSELGDRRPTLFADLSRQVYDVSEHGLFGLELDPDFPRRPYVYVAYTHNAAIGGTAPRWSSPSGADVCPDPPGLDEDGCVSSGRVSVLTARGDRMAGAERVLIED